jgi:hypothetical protein
MLDEISDIRSIVLPISQIADTESFVADEI